jgi:Adenosylmethionine decarboxylase
MTIIEAAAGGGGASSAGVVNNADDHHHHHNDELHFPPPVFEGSEKRLEIDFYAPDPSMAASRGLRAIPRSDLDALLDDVSFFFLFCFRFGESKRGERPAWQISSLSASRIRIPRLRLRCPFLARWLTFEPRERFVSSERK